MFNTEETGMIFFIIGIVVVAAIGFGGRWLFRQRDPGDIVAAREKLKRYRKK